MAKQSINGLINGDYWTLMFKTKREARGYTFAATLLVSEH